jgi:hypothetical protein
MVFKHKFTYGEHEISESDLAEYNARHNSHVTADEARLYVKICASAARYGDDDPVATQLYHRVMRSVPAEHHGIRMELIEIAWQRHKATGIDVTITVR